MTAYSTGISNDNQSSEIQKGRVLHTAIRDGRNNDHSGELRSFPNAKIYISREGVGSPELRGIPNIIPVDFTDGAYYNFPECQKIIEGIYYIKAKGHTNGNSLIIAENDGLFYMFEGDITYVDEALHENRLSAVFEDLQAARETLAIKSNAGELSEEEKQKRRDILMASLRIRQTNFELSKQKKGQ